MTYLRILNLLTRVLSRVMRCVDQESRLWAELGDLYGRVAFRRMSYVKRVQQVSGWDRVEVTRRPASWVTAEPTTTVAGPTTVTMRWNGWRP